MIFHQWFIGWSRWSLNAIALMTIASSCFAKNDEVEFDEQTGQRTVVKHLTVHPRPVPRPALKVRLLPDAFDLQDGNAALYYLKAVGFLEQDAARRRLDELRRQAGTKAHEQGIDNYTLPPYSYETMSPDEMPVEEIREFLRLTDFQTPLLEVARWQRSFSLDRHIRQVDDPMGYLVPEIQAMRELARLQSMRCRLALAENRIDDALRILGQQLALAQHLGQDEFLVSNLVGIAVLGMVWDDACYLVQHAECPSLYWALAQLPVPLVDTRNSDSFEKNMAFLQFKLLQEIDQQPRSEDYWRDFVVRFSRQSEGYWREIFGQFALPGWLHLSPESSNSTVSQSLDNPARIVLAITASYPTARQYLLERSAIPAEVIEAFPAAQVFFVAMKVYYEEVRDEQFKWANMPMHIQLAGLRQAEDSLFQNQHLGAFTKLATSMSPGVLAGRTAQARSHQSLLVLQAIEALRLHAAEHGGKLPGSWGEIVVPVPHDPATDRPFEYRLDGETATLMTAPLDSYRTRVHLRIAGE